MKLRIRSIARLLLAAALAVSTPGVARAGEFLTEQQLAAELGSHTIKGYYTGNRIGFVEVYLADGRITYKDDLKADVGRWSVRANTFCTFYDNIAGSCWFVIKRSDNCFEFYAAGRGGPSTVTKDDLEALEPDALAARDAEKVSCKEWHGA